ncbi:MAG TPA: NADH:ubiquinone reductase (Na(+)-transporting) subunit C [Flavobacterium sp.]|uniref:NADH:ubiquinone reductase (Na(+)-transporting) subunit C n=1 Tax=unclassified Flavobacterium TaxID=196869 RepID=UPI000E99B6DA|nr:MULTISPECIES: NADH:ubiquinone reductase (Na(+)-transporting) subunit C [unclassified Flavobacterium]HBI01964.1 NADH:ubiquinone reductase (Na(+)-transporting) subunit C [Flavobacterium sp.]HRE78631.1 NADH:ubiquinone reductase (Na(+)-transporting) subunit C [Flavobacterium sp.]
MDRNSNGYTFLFAGIMVVVVGALLAFAATSLKPMQDVNVRNEKMQNILTTVGVTGISREEAQAKFDEVIKSGYLINADGTATEDRQKTFEIDLKTEVKKDVAQQKFPLFVAEKDGETFYIIPLRGAGLWDAIWGYVSLEKDMNTVKGVVFDHKGETPGLGAEITQPWFLDRFVGEKIFTTEGELVGIEVKKGYTGGNDKDDNKVDAISGATITGDGVSAMIKERLSHYGNYFSSQKSKLALKN